MILVSVTLWVHIWGFLNIWWWQIIYNFTMKPISWYHAMQLRLGSIVVCDMVHHMIPCSQLHRDMFLPNRWPSCCLAVSTNPSNTRLSRWLLPKRQLAWVSDDVAGGKGRGWDCNETERTPPCKLGSGSKCSTLMVSLVQPCHTERNKRNSCQVGLFHKFHICSYYEQCQHPAPRKVASPCVRRWSVSIGQDPQ